MLTSDSDTLTGQFCSCGSGESYANCCQPFHQKQSFPITAEQLMRSRFSAFHLGLVEYLKDSWDETTCPEDLSLDDSVNWLSLSINGRKKGRKKDQEGWVTFMATYEVAGQQGTLHEKSYFRRDTDSHWRYVDGEIKS